MFFIVVWVLSPIVLIPWLISLLVRKKRTTNEMEEMRDQLRHADQEISHLQQRIKNLKEFYANTGSNSGEASNIAKTSDGEVAASEVVKAKVVADVVADTGSEVAAVVETSTGVVGNTTTVNESVSSEVVNIATVVETDSRESVDITANVLFENNKINTNATERTAGYEPVVENREHKISLPSGTVMFGIGILFVLVAGAIFATTTWQILSSFGKVLTLLGAVAVFFISSLLAEKKFGLRETSITFYLLGSSFLSVVNLGVGYFRWFGDAYALEGQQAFLVWSVSLLILTVCLAIGFKIYSVNLLGLLSYLSFLFGSMLLVRYPVETNYVVLLVAGIYIALSWAYIYYRQSLGYSVCFEKCVDKISYLFLLTTLISLAGDINFILAIMILVLGLVISFEMSVLFFGKIKNLGVLEIYSAFLAIAVFVKVLEEYSYKPAVIVGALAPVVYVFIFKFVKFGEDRILGNSLSDILSGILLFISSIISFTCVEFNMRSLPFAYVMSLLAIWIVLLAVFVFFIFKFKEQGRKSARLMDFINADIGVWAISLIFGAIYSEKELLILPIIAVVISAAVYVCFELQENNYAGFVPVTSMFIMLAQIAYILDNDKHIANLIINVVLFLVVILVGRLRYKSTYVVNENQKLIDWLGTLSIIFVYAASYTDRRFIAFVIYLMLTIYFANYYGRVSSIIQKFLLSFSAVMFGFALANWPFFEIKSSFETEWNISILMLVIVLLGFIWRNIEEIYSRLAGLLVVFIYIFYFFDIDSELVFLSTGKTMYIAVLKILFYLTGAIIPFGFACWRNKRPYYITSGIVLAGSTAIVGALVSKWIIIIPVLLGVIYTAYIYIKNKKNYMIFPIVQLYLLLWGLDIPVYFYLPIFIVSIVYGYMKYDRVVDRYGFGLEIDWFTITAFIPLLLVFSGNEDRWFFCTGMMLAAYILSFYRRITSMEEVNRLILTIVSIVMCITMIKMPFIEISESWETEWFLIFAWIAIIFNIAYVYKNTADTNKYYILYFFAIASIIWQAADAISSDNVRDALILGILMTALLIFSFIYKKKMWFLLAAITLILQGIYTSRHFWLSIAWWVYLLVVGVLFIGIAAVNEYRKRNDVEDHIQMNLFSDWNNW